VARATYPVCLNTQCRGTYGAMCDQVPDCRPETG
jgi:hypothetical protein